MWPPLLCVARQLPFHDVEVDGFGLSLQVETLTQLYISSWEVVSTAVLFVFSLMFIYF